ncbi:MAG: hemerythrin domain-containing protein, partial [Nitrospinales bacterium]
DAQSHIAKHKTLVKQVGDYCERFKQGDKTIGNELLNFLKDWLIKHIMGVDRQYSEHLNSKGVV